MQVWQFFLQITEARCRLYTNKFLVRIPRRAKGCPFEPSLLYEQKHSRKMLTECLLNAHLMVTWCIPSAHQCLPNGDRVHTECSPDAYRSGT